MIRFAPEPYRSLAIGNEISSVGELDQRTGTKHLSRLQYPSASSVPISTQRTQVTTGGSARRSRLIAPPEPDGNGFQSPRQAYIAGRSHVVDEGALADKRYRAVISYSGWNLKLKDNP